MYVINESKSIIDYSKIRFTKPSEFKPDKTYTAVIVKFKAFIDYDGLKNFEFTLSVADEFGGYGKYKKLYPIITHHDSVICRLLYELDAISDKGTIIVENLINKKVHVNFTFGKWGNFYIASIFPLPKD